MKFYCSLPYFKYKLTDIGKLKQILKKFKYIQKKNLSSQFNLRNKKVRNKPDIAK